MKNNCGEKEEITIIRDLLIKDLYYNVPSSSVPELKDNLIAYLQHLLDKDFERLLQGLYRIDVNEDNVKEILNCGSPENIAGRLADLILNRLQQKAITRMQYR